MMRLLFLICLLFVASCDSIFEELVRRQMIIFASDRDGSGNMNLWMMTPEGEDLRQLTHYTHGYYWPADISPDGKHVLFYRLDDFDPKSGLYIMPIDGPEPELPFQRGVIAGASFFPDGQRFIYREGYTLKVYDFRDRSIETLRTGLPASNPDIAQDGSKICFSTQTDTTWQTEEIFLVNPDGSNPVSLTPHEESNYALFCSFSPEGDKVFFTLNGDITWLELETGEQHVLQDIKGARPVSDTSGTRLFFRAEAGGTPRWDWEIVAIDIDGGNLRRLTRDRFIDEKPLVGVVEFRE